MKPATSGRFFIYLAVLVIAGLFIRFWVAYHYHGTYDVSSWEMLFDHWREGKSPYDLSRRYSYSPIWFWVLSVSSWANIFLRFPTYFAVKLPLIFTDLLILIVLLKFARLLGQTPRQRVVTAALFFLNPVSFLNTAYHGQFDNLAYLFVLMACYFSYQSQIKSGLKNALSFYTAIAVKHATILVMPVFAFRQKSWKKAFLFCFLSPSILILTLVPFFLNGDRFVLQNIFWDGAVNLRIIPGHWGWPLLLDRIMHSAAGIDIRTDPRFGFLRHLNYFLYPFLMIVAYRLARRKNDLIDTMIVYFLFFYVFSLLMAPQYTVWILPFAVLNRERPLYIYSFIVTLHLIAFYIWEAFMNVGDRISAGMCDPFIIFLRILSWVWTIIWLANKLKRVRDEAIQIQ